jgi:hypothetical protein
MPGLDTRLMQEWKWVLSGNWSKLANRNVNAKRCVRTSRTGIVKLYSQSFALDIQDIWKFSQAIQGSCKKRPFLNNRQEYIQVLCTISVLLFRSHQWELKVAPIHCPKLDFGNTANKRLKNRRFELWIDLVASKAGSVKCRTMLPRINLETVSHFSKLCSHRGNLCQRQSYRNGYAWHKS